MTDTKHRGHYVSHMQCYVQRISYDFALKTGEVWMPEVSCTDMHGAIEWFGDIDDDVRTIITWSAGRLDTTYIRDEVGNWHAAEAPL